MSAASFHVERLALSVHGLPESTVRDALVGLDAAVAALLAEAPHGLPDAIERARVSATPLNVPAGVAADGLRRLLAERVVEALGVTPGGAG